MYISGFKIQNYKSYWDTPEVPLARGMNVLTGPNNAGKTALLEALALDFSNNPHRSLLNAPKEDTFVSQWSAVEMTVCLSNGDLLNAVSGREIDIPLPARNTKYGDGTVVRRHDEGEAEAFVRWLFERDFHTFHFRREVDGRQIRTVLPRSPSLGTYRAEQGTDIPMIRCVVGPDNSVSRVGVVQVARTNDFGGALAQKVSDRIYRFNAQRLHTGLSPSGSNHVLSANAINLPEVLCVLQGTGVVFQMYKSLVRSILPHVRDITIAPENTQQKILIWTEAAYISGRRDLAFGLDACGTGVGQVLAILYVALTARSPQVLLIDEPQSFLHPGAARKLAEVLRRHPEHQYIVATHSPTIITATEPSLVILTSHDGNQSQLRQIDRTKANQLREYLAEIGASLADLFGADCILWVEGPTEEQCYDVIVKRLLKRPLGGKVIKAIVATGDLEGKHARRFFEMYRRVSASDSLLPPALAFLLDDECRSAPEKKELNELGENKVQFTGRRMYENYLLNPRAIASVLNQLEQQDGRHSEETVSPLIEECMQNDRFFLEHPTHPKTIEWIHAADVLKKIFRTLAKFEYKKTSHSVALTEWLIDNEPTELTDIAEQLRTLLEIP